MRDTTKKLRFRHLSQVAVLALVGGVSAGCSSDVSRFGTFFEPTDNRAATVRQPDVAVTGSLPPADAAPRTPVSAGQLPPVPGAVAAANTAPMVRPPSFGEQTWQQPAPATAPAPSATVAAAPAGTPTRPGWNAAGGSIVAMRPGETVATLSTRYNVPVDAILKANGLASAAQAQPGQQIVIPVYSLGGPSVANAPVPQATMTAPTQQAGIAAPPARPLGTLPAGTAAAAADGVYVVKPGDSLGRIANGYGMRSTELAALNGISASDPIRVGQKLRLPQGGAAPQQVAALTPATMTDATPGRVPSPQPAVRPAQAQTQQPANAPAAPAQAPQQTGLAPMPTRSEPQQSAALAPAPAPSAAAPAPAATESASAASKSFRWPVNGRIISNFGKKPNGERNDGINLEVPEGTPIKAAEGGTVIYSGNELKGYGNLVLVKHSNGMVSAYAHASELLVRRGDQVRRGQTIGKVGATGSVARPQLHFELREGNRPLDPLPFLNG
ncbi:peptidoglycan DD-metalloendopeptidase family protein [Methylobrevis albus]|uniref:Peptidoglycan DD-metalloendopeptidase family protein n=1 Tax=Methylobrevis albus TaxID=2793297 RepID=A0A931I436_9HYPH|nr:peptidoglycan DD-metalloendopeptidase family protein [Methylobrevis albus]MBH0238880.1 peptidoglycan DD-metalloendopeptidase family protein [Methylobrevis albus]